MNILALDLGTRMGWAQWHAERIESGVQVFDLQRGESPGMRYLRFNAWLDEVAKPRAHLLVYEQTHQRGGAATEVAAGFATRVQEFCARYTIEHAAVHSATLKKWTTGKGNADKRMMLAAVNHRWRGGSPPLTDDNHADALALLHYALAHFAKGAL